MIHVGLPVHMAEMIGTTSSRLWPARCNGSGTVVVLAQVASRSVKRSARWKKSMASGW